MRKIFNEFTFFFNKMKNKIKKIRQRENYT